jgi:hypothetical protein
VKVALPMNTSLAVVNSRSGRGRLKLVSGAVMLALATALLLFPRVLV